ncbi:MAG TPA: hypothetical protein VF266_26485 [Thermoanaerobaculia bacterium]
MKRALALIALFACAVTARAATDVLTIASATVPKGTVTIPVYVRDVATTRLGADKTTGLRIQALAFRVTFAPAGSVTSASFTRAGLLSGKTPLFESVMPVTNGVGYVASFAESTNALPFNTSTAAPGHLIGNLSITMGAGVVPGNVITAGFDTTHTALSNQAGTVTETFANAGLTLQHGIITVSSESCPALATPTISVEGRAGACASGTGGTASVPFLGPVTTYEWGWRASPNGTTFPIATANQASYVINGADFGGTGTRYLVVTATSSCAQSTSSPLQVNITSAPGATLNASTGVYASSTDNYASVADQGPGATYNWAVTNGTITSGQGTRAIRYTAGASGTVGVDVTVTAPGCSGSSSPHADVAIITRPAGASMLYLLTPCRVYDSRGTTAIENGQDRPITVGGVCGVPAGAKAVAANITVITPLTDGWLSAYPSDLPWSGTSTINYRVTRTRANNAVVPLSSDGRMTLKNSGSTLHFIVDVTGYFK